MFIINQFRTCVALTHFQAPALPGFSPRVIDWRRPRQCRDCTVVGVTQGKYACKTEWIRRNVGCISSYETWGVIRHINLHFIFEYYLCTHSYSCILVLFVIMLFIYVSLYLFLFLYSYSSILILLFLFFYYYSSILILLFLFLYSYNLCPNVIQIHILILILILVFL